ncbi:helix-turn-helix domain-containing protein [Natrialbaceae archaeon A-CW3]
MQTTVRQTNLTVPSDLESSQAKLLYLSLAVCDDATVDDLCTDLNVDKGSALSILGTLRERGYVERADGQYRVVQTAR